MAFSGQHVAVPLPLAFGFGATGMLWFLAAAAAPFLIHLWNKRRYRELDWAAMEYLLAALKSNSRKLLVEQWVLLAARTLAVLLLALAAAEPFFERVGLSFAPGERTHRMIVLDGSYSMDFQPADASRFDRAKELARSIVEASNEGDGFTLLMLGQPPDAIISTPAYSAESFLEVLDELRHPQAGGDLPSTMLRVEELLKQTRRDHPKLAREEIYVITDLGAQTWSPRFATPEVATEFHERMVRVSQDAAVVLLDVGQVGGGNLAITNLTATAGAPVTGAEVSFYAQVHNFGRQARERVVIDFMVDGARVDQNVVDLPATGSTDLPPFKYRFGSPGDHRVEVRVAEDSLAPDDARFLVMPVRKAFRVLCINGKPSGVPFESATDYLDAALQSSSAAGRAPIETDVGTELDLVRSNLEAYDAIFLCNVRQFRPAEAAQLRKFVERGGGLITFLGDHVDVANYNDVLVSGDNRVLPAELGQLVSHDPADVEELDPLRYRHPVLDPFRQNEQVAFTRTPIYKYFRLSPLTDDGAETAVAFSGGDPLIVEGRIARGYSLLVATSAAAGPRDDLWTAMPMLQNFVPLVRQLLAISIRGKIDSRNVLVSDPLSAAAPLTAADSQMVIETPTDEVKDIRLREDGELSLWNYQDTRYAGFYRAIPTVTDAAGGLFAVNLDTSESDLARVSPEELRDGLLAGVTYTLEEEYRQIDDQPLREITQRGELQRWLLLASLGLFLFEMVLAWRLRSDSQ
ncbi:MAG: BatA domain-containing protein [Pirellulales bacterium]|nr:BatA domain-containing protein [Pirellulales bacterium]